MIAESVGPAVQNVAGDCEFHAPPPNRLGATAESELKHLSFLSHDLNNNLSAIHLHLELLKERLARLPDCARDLSSLDLAQQSIRRTTDGMRRLLAHARDQRGPTGPKASPVNLFDLTTSVVAQHRDQACAKGLALSVQAPCNAIAHSDAALIALVLQNLVGNSVKHSTRGAVRILCRRRRHARGRQWLISVADEGPGIPAWLLARMFVAFQRGAAEGNDGFGLGLTVALEAAGMLGAELWAASEVGVGSVFHLALPPVERQRAVRRG